MANERIGSFTLTQVSGSPNYYARFRRNGRQVTRSLGTDDLETARTKLEAMAETTPGTARQTQDHSFQRYALQTIEDDRRKVQRGERAATLVSDGERILKAYCAKELGDLDIRDVTYQHLTELVDQLTDRGLSSATLKVILVFINKTFKTAARVGILKAVPLLPEVSLKAGVRGWFSHEEYRNLLRACKECADAKIKVRSTVITDELRLYVTFMVNTFLRPSDSKLLKHRNIEVVKTKEAQYLRISTEFSKTENTPIISMPIAVEIYQRLVKLQQSRGFGRGDDYLFLPRYRKRRFAMEMLRRQFGEVLRMADLATSKSGEPRTLYSLRHTAIMFRLLQGDKIDLLTLARNARTSVEMIDRFYAKHLTAEMNVQQFQSMR